MLHTKDYFRLQGTHRLKVKEEKGYSMQMGAEERRRIYTYIRKKLVFKSKLETKNFIYDDKGINLSVEYNIYII